MTPRATSRFFLFASAITMVTVVTGAGYADTPPSYGQPPPQEKDVGERVGTFFRRLFYGEWSGEPDPPPPPRRHTRARSNQGQGYNLDQGPVSSASDDRDFPSAPPERVSRKSESRESDTRGDRSATEKPIQRDAPPKEHVEKPRHKLEELPEVSSEKPKPKRTAPTPSVVANDPPKHVTNPPVKEKKVFVDTEVDRPEHAAPKKTETHSVAKTESAPPSKTPAHVADSGGNVSSSPSTDAGAPEKSKGGSEVMEGKKIGKPGRVKSPYPPYSELDVAGLPSGSMAMDPTTQRVFRVP